MNCRVKKKMLQIFKAVIAFSTLHSISFGAESQKIIEPQKWEEERSFSYKEHFLGLSTGVSFPSVEVESDEDYYYQQNIQFNSRGTIYGGLDYSVDVFYNRTLSRNWSNKLGKNESFKGNLLLGYGFPEINPGWKFVLRGGLYADDQNLVRLSHGRKNIIAPQVSPLWLFEQQDGSLFHMSFSYIHLDRGQLFSKPGDDHEYGILFKIGETIPISKTFGFLYNLDLEMFRVGNKELNSTAVKNISFNVGLAI